MFSSDSNMNDRESGRLLQDNDTAGKFSLTAELAGNDLSGGLSTTPIEISSMAGGALFAGMLFG